MASYADVFLYEGGALKNIEQYKGDYTEAEIQELVAYVASQPAATDFSSLQEDEKETLTIRRKWALVHYVASLYQKPGIFHWLFGVDTEVTHQF